MCMYGHTCIDVDKVDKVNAFTVTVRRAQVPKMQQKNTRTHPRTLTPHTTNTDTQRHIEDTHTQISYR